MRVNVPGSTPVYVDGYARDEEGRIVIYEFFGCFWHGHDKCFPGPRVNPVSQQTFGTLYASTMDRVERLSRAYKFNHIWECDLRKMLRRDPDMRAFFEKYRVSILKNEISNTKIFFRVFNLYPE